MTTYKQPSRINEAIEILRTTHDGNDLAPYELSLLQAAVNGNLTKDGVDAFDKLHQNVVAGTYQKPWLFGIENLTIDHDGCVFWRAVHEVERYCFWSADSYDRLRPQAIDLARRCEHLESLNITPSLSSVLDNKLFPSQ